MSDAILHARIEAGTGKITYTYGPQPLGVPVVAPPPVPVSPPSNVISPSSASPLSVMTYAGSLYLLVDVAVQGRLTLNGPPLDNLDAATKQYVDAATAGGAALGFVLYVDGMPTNDQTLARFVVEDGFTFAADLLGCAALAEEAASDSTVFTVRKNGTAVGDFTFAAEATTATLSSVGEPVAFATGDIFALTAPETADATLANIGFTFKATRA